MLAALPPSGTPRATIGQALASLFKTLKGHKVIFINPTARITIGPAPANLPLPVDLDRLRQALHSTDPARSVLAALIAFHGLPPRQLRALQLTDLRDGRLHLPDRVITLAEPVTQRLATYLEYRNQRWPNTANPHLFIHIHTAGHLRPVLADWITHTLGMSAPAILEDRILHFTDRSPACS